MKYMVSNPEDKMKKIIIAITFLLLACSNPIEPTTESLPIEQSQLIGTWERGGKAFDFYENGNFRYYSMIDGTEYNYGYYEEYREDGLLFLCDPMQFIEVWYFYEVIDDSLFLSIDGVLFAEWVRE